MLKITCDNSRCRMYGVELNTGGTVEPLPDTCLSCRRKLKRMVELDMGQCVSLQGAPANCDGEDSVEDNVRATSITPGIWGASILQTLKGVQRVVDEAEVPTEGRGLYNPDTDVVEWMEGRDSINESFINLLARARDLGAFHIESKLMEMNRELLAVLSAKIDDEDEDEDADDDFYRLMP